MPCQYSRRQWIINAGAAVSGAYLGGAQFGNAATAPTSPVVVSRCQTYNPNELVPVMQKMFDQLGGLDRLVRNKTVAIKVNLTGSPTYRLGYHPLEDTHYTHPQVIGTAVHLMGKAGARRIRILESPWSTAAPVEEYILQALRVGASGYLLKDASAQELAEAVKTVMLGETYLSASITRYLADYVRRVDGEKSETAALTPRKLEILKLIAEGKSTKQIAHMLNISVKTVETHRAQLMEQLGIYDIAGLVRYAIRSGIVTMLP